MSLLKKILIGVVALVIILQFFRIDKTNPPVDPTLDLIQMGNLSSEVSGIIKTSCYDCHSNETLYPWYTNVAPVSWWIKKHIDEGRDELNFSEWGKYTDRRKDNKLRHFIELVDEDEMPLPSYLWGHSDARLNADQKALIVDWAKITKAEIGYVPEPKKE